MDTGTRIARRRPAAKLWRLVLVALLLAVLLSSCSQVQPTAARAEKTYRDAEQKFDEGLPRWLAPVDRALNDLAVELRQVFSGIVGGLPQ